MNIINPDRISNLSGFLYFSLFTGFVWGISLLLCETSIKLYKLKTIVPYKEETSGKKEQVSRMFDNISGRYDFLNHFLSAGIDIIWRKKAIRRLKKEKPQLLLDVATGTGDLALEAQRILRPEKIIGVDISKGMLEIGREKIKKKKLEDRIVLQEGDSENLQFADNYFDAVIVSYGVRNFENLEKGLQEMARVVKQGGSVVILEFSRPRRFPFKQLFHVYFRYILPFIGKLISRDKSAYTYLPESVQAFPEGTTFVEILKRSGFSEATWIPLTFGISAIYHARK